MQTNLHISGSIVQVYGLSTKAAASIQFVLEKHSRKGTTDFFCFRNAPCETWRNPRKENPTALERNKHSHYCEWQVNQVNVGTDCLSAKDAVFPLFYSEFIRNPSGRLLSTINTCEASASVTANSSIRLRRRSSFCCDRISKVL